MVLTKESILEEIKDWSVEELDHLNMGIAELHEINSKRDRFESKRPILLIANADYEGRCTEGYKPNIRATERWWKLKPGSLANFRNNSHKRNHSKVVKVKRKKKEK